VHEEAWLNCREGLAQTDGGKLCDHNGGHAWTSSIVTEDLAFSGRLAGVLAFLQLVLWLWGRLWRHHLLRLNCLLQRTWSEALDVIDDNVDGVQWSVDFYYVLYLLLAVQVALLLLNAVTQVVRSLLQLELLRRLASGRRCGRRIPWCGSILGDIADWCWRRSACLCFRCALLCLVSMWLIFWRPFFTCSVSHIRILNVLLGTFIQILPGSILENGLLVLFLLVLYPSLLRWLTHA